MNYFLAPCCKFEYHAVDHDEAVNGDCIVVANCRCPQRIVLRKIQQKKEDIGCGITALFEASKSVMERSCAQSRADRISPSSSHQRSIVQQNSYQNLATHLNVSEVCKTYMLSGICIGSGFPITIIDAA